METVAIIPAAGAGIRMEADQAKQFLDLNGRPILAVTLEAFQACPAIQGIILVVPPGEMNSCRENIVERYGLDKVKKVVTGGKRRQDSVRFGLEASGGDYGLVMIHDGVRPLIRPDLIERIVAAAERDRSVIAALPARDTVKEVDGDGLVRKTYDRNRVWLVQTPQVFRYEDINTAHHKAVREGWNDITDDALLMEKAGIPVKVLEGAEDNIKITTAHDLELARFLLSRYKATV